MLDTATQQLPPDNIKPIATPRAPSRRVRTAAEVTIHSPQVRPQSLLDVILTAGSDKNFDIEKFERLVAMQQNEQDRQYARDDALAATEAEAAFNTAMNAVQKKMTTVRASIENTQTRSMYADYAALDRMLRPIYSEADFALSYGEEDSPKPDHVRAYCLVTHSPAGAKRSFTRKYHVDMPADGKGARGGDVMTRTHATKSAFTYSQGVLVRLIWNIAVSKDDDGNAASAPKPAPTTAAPDPGCINAAQAAQIRKMLDDRGISHIAYLQSINLASIELIGIQHFAKAIAKITNVGGKS